MVLEEAAVPDPVPPPAALADAAPPFGPALLATVPDAAPPAAAAEDDLPIPPLPPEPPAPAAAAAAEPEAEPEADPGLPVAAVEAAEPAPFPLAVLALAADPPSLLPEAADPAALPSVVEVVVDDVDVLPEPESSSTAVVVVVLDPLGNELDKRSRVAAPNKLNGFVIALSNQAPVEAPPEAMRF